VRPATALICQFIDQKKQEFGVAPICRVLCEHGIQIAPRTYWARLGAAPGKRALAGRDQGPQDAHHRA
jgi:putative transposase